MSETHQETHQESPITILGQLIKDLSFEHPDPIASQMLALDGKEPDLNVETSVSYRSLQDEGKGYEVLLNMKVSGKHDNQTMFLIELAYASYVAINHEMIPADHIEPVLMISIPHMLFPFARAIIYSTMRDGGLPPLLLNPMDFEAAYEANKSQK